MNKSYDKIIIGAGLYGMYGALFSAKKGENVLVLEYDEGPFKRATYINQARVHMGYHYPRSLSTAVKSAGYFRRFAKEYDFCIHKSFDQVYATSSQFSWTDAKQFVNFCEAAQIRCDEVACGKYFHKGVCDGAYITEEYTYDAMILRNYFLEKTTEEKHINIQYGVRISTIQKRGLEYEVILEDGTCYRTGYILNASYASTNQILQLVEEKYPLFDIKYELCEIIVCKPSKTLENIGITVMDGPFFSIMPFGKSGLHSLTSVTFTPHVTSYEAMPSFSCQQGTDCHSTQLGNCNDCKNRPDTAWDYMNRLTKKYVKDEYRYEYVSSLFSMKPILKTSEVDDSRPTRIRVDSISPRFVSVLSGKINTVYDLEEYL